MPPTTITSTDGAGARGGHDDAFAAFDNGDGDFPDALKCPVSLCVFEDPVVTPLGHTFERAVLQQHLQATPACPLTRAPLHMSHVVTNRALRDVIPEVRAIRQALRAALARAERAEKAAATRRWEAQRQCPACVRCSPSCGVHLHQQKQQQQQQQPQQRAEAALPPPPKRSRAEGDPLASAAAASATATTAAAAAPTARVAGDGGLAPADGGDAKSIVPGLDWVTTPLEARRSANRVAFMMHACRCRRRPGADPCQYAWCPLFRDLAAHIRQCTRRQQQQTDQQSCGNAHCARTKAAWAHFRACANKAGCPMCSRVLKTVGFQPTVAHRQNQQRQQSRTAMAARTPPSTTAAAAASAGAVAAAQGPAAAQGSVATDQEALQATKPCRPRRQREQQQQQQQQGKQQQRRRSLYAVVVPAGTKPGDTLRVNIGGRLCDAIIPAGLQAGKVMHVFAPAEHRHTVAAQQWQRRRKRKQPHGQARPAVGGGANAGVNDSATPAAAAPGAVAV